MKRVLAIIISVTLLFSLLIGCSNDISDEEIEQRTETSEQSRALVPFHLEGITTPYKTPSDKSTKNNDKQSHHNKEHKSQK